MTKKRINVDKIPLEYGVSRSQKRSFFYTFNHPCSFKSDVFRPVLCTFNHPCSFKIYVFRSFYILSHPPCSFKIDGFASSIQKRQNYIALFGMGRFWGWGWRQRAPIPLAYLARCLIWQICIQVLLKPIDVPHLSARN